jgi:hypothetical protein
MKYWILIFVITIVSSCSENDNKLVLNNDTEEKIMYYDEFMNENNFIPNLIDCDNGSLYYVDSKLEERITSPTVWEAYFKENPNNLLRIYIFNKDTVEKYGKCKVLKNKMTIKRYDLTLDDMKKMNWRIVYDGVAHDN